MSEKTKSPQNNQPEKAKTSAKEKTEIGDQNSWSTDQQEKSYYYDDACGYELYVPDEDEEEK